jgi:hypothetical protein
MHEIRREGIDFLKPETERYLDKARQALREARAVAGIGLAEAAGRRAETVHLGIFRAPQNCHDGMISRVP